MLSHGGKKSPTQLKNRLLFWLGCVVCFIVSVKTPLCVSCHYIFGWYSIKHRLKRFKHGISCREIEAVADWVVCVLSVWGRQREYTIQPQHSFIHPSRNEFIHVSQSHNHSNRLVQLRLNK